MKSFVNRDAFLGIVGDHDTGSTFSISLNAEWRSIVIAAILQYYRFGETSSDELNSQDMLNNFIADVYD